jgi:hypothetical protein
LAASRQYSFRPFSALHGLSTIFPEVPDWSRTKSKTGKSEQEFRSFDHNMRRISVDGEAIPMEENLMARWYSLLAEQDRSKGKPIHSRIETFRLARYAFDKNHESLQRAIEAMAPDPTPDDSTIHEFGARTRPGLFEVCRCLQNYIISAKTLVEQSRALHRSLYEKEGKLTGYNDELKRRFEKNGLHHFIQGLRNMIAHDRLPIVTFYVHRRIWVGEESSATYQVRFLKSALVQYDKWNTEAKAFLNELSGEIDLAAISRDYHQQVDEFHIWFAQKQRDAHKEELDHYEGLEVQLAQLAIDIRQKHREKFGMPSTESPTGTDSNQCG